MSCELATSPEYIDLKLLRRWNAATRSSIVRISFLSEARIKFFLEHPSPEKNHYTTPFLFMTKDQVLERARNSSSSLSNAAPCYVVFCGKIAVCRRRSFLFFKWAFSFYYCGTQSFRNFYLFFRKPSSFSSLELKLRKSDFRARRRSRKRKEWEEMRFMHIRFFFSFYTFFPT